MSHSINRRYDLDVGNTASARTQQPYEEFSPRRPTMAQYDHTSVVSNGQHGDFPPDVEGYDWQQEAAQDDNNFPFDGYNVEDLWEWMLYFDSKSEAISDACI